MEKADLSGCLVDPLYRPLRSETLDRLNLKPHHALYNNTHRRLVVLLKQGNGGDYSANAAMIKSLCDLQDKIAQAYIVHVVDNQVIAWETALNVARKINGLTPRDGEYGPYFWLKEHTFSVAGTSWTDEELPF